MRLLLLPNSHNSPPSRFRIWQFIKPLRELGNQVDVCVIKPERTWSSSSRSPLLRYFHNQVGSILRVLHALLLISRSGPYDVIMMNRDLVPSVRVGWLEPLLAKRNPRVIFDFDDAIHLGARGVKLRKILPHFAWITPGNEYLAEFARSFHSKVTVLPTVIDCEYYQPVPRRRPGPIRVGWSGSRSTLQYCLPPLENVLKRLSREIDFEFIVIADVPPEIRWSGVNMRYIPWTADTEVEGLQQIDIGLMPLNDSPFERGKCGLKAIQYMGVGIPSLVSPVGVNQNIVLDGTTGFHCRSDEDWIQSILYLINDTNLRKTMGLAARDRVEKYYSIQSLLPRMVTLFEKVSKQY